MAVNNGMPSPEGRDLALYVPRTVDTEGYELRRIPYWMSPRTGKQVHYDTFWILYYRYRMTLTDFYEEMRKRGFTAGPAYVVLGEFERRELKELSAMFRVDPTMPTKIRVEGRMTEILAYTIIEKVMIVKLILTFSIETGLGHEPFYAEVTTDTITPEGATQEDLDEMTTRILNAVLKFFWIHFDAFKDVHKGEDRLLRWTVRLTKYLTRIEEEEMDRYLKAMIEAGKLSRPPDEYVTRMALIKIGIEYEVTAEKEPKYPLVHVLVEKTEPRTYTLDKEIIIAAKTDVDMVKILEIMIE